jgi:hypothetical protein
VSFPESVSVSFPFPELVSFPLFSLFPSFWPLFPSFESFGEVSSVRSVSVFVSVSVFELGLSVDYVGAQSGSS